MRVALVFAVPFASLIASTALAQVKPVVTGSQVPAAAQLLNIEEIGDDAPIELDWTASVNTLEAYEYEISYDQGRSTTTTTVTLVRLDDTINAGDNTGPVQSGVRERFRIRPSQIVPADALPGAANVVDDAQRTIVLRVFRSASPTDDNTAATFTWKFQYDTKPPAAPSVTKVVAGERRLGVSWAAPSPDTDVDTYSVLWCGDASAVVDTSTLAALPCSSPRVTSGIDRSQTTYSIEEGLTNDLPAAVAVRGIDEYGNDGVLSNVAVGTPAEVTDFFELYKEQGGGEDGGFCFIATAAYGSYAHPTVRVLRWFRDIVLEASPLGQLFVATYYRLSPPLAAIVAQDATLAAWTRAALVPVAAGALGVMLLPLAGLVVLVRQRLRRRAGRVAVEVALSAVLVIALPAASAHAESLMRSKSERRFGLGFEIKGGPYLPALGEEGGGTEGIEAFETIFGSRPNPLYSIGLDLQLYRGFGTLGVGGSFGFMQFVGKSYYGEGGDRSSDTTVFNLMPLTLTAFYRFDWLADRSWFPFVPYARGGLAYDVWWVTNGTGDIARWEGPDKEGSEDDVVGRGGKLGLTGTVGVALLLNVIDLDAARALFDSTGIRGTSLFGEYTVAKGDGFGDGGFDLSDDTWNLGIYFEW